MAKYRVTARAFTGADWSPANTLVDVDAIVETDAEVGSAYELIEGDKPAKPTAAERRAAATAEAEAAEKAKAEANLA